MAESERIDDLDRRIGVGLKEMVPADAVRTAPPDSVWLGIAAGLAAPPVEIAARRRTPRWAVAAIGAAAAVGALAVGIANRNGDDTVTLATATLTSEGLTGAPDGAAVAAVVDRSDRRVLRLDLDTTRPASGEYLELWLITPDISGMVSLGAARPDGTYDLPPGLEVGEYPVVDVSTEPYDGDPAHSGVSLLRGQLQIST